MLNTTKAKKALKNNFQWGGLDKVLVDEILDNAKWSIQMVSATKAKSAEVISKIGGFPNLPSDIEWPIYQGEPMAFIAQMDLSEIPNAKELGLPSKGVLFFFYDSKQSWGFSKTNAGAAQVIFVEDNSLIPPKAKVIKKYIKDVWDSYKIITKEKKVSFIPELMLPTYSDVDWDSFDVDDDTGYEYSYGWSSHIRSDHWLFGFADRIQSRDPLSEGYRATLKEIDAARSAEPENLDDISSDVRSDPKDWVLLAQFGSDYRSGTEEMMWGDCGKIYFIIHRLDFAKKDFRRVWVVLQCS